MIVRVGASINPPREIMERLGVTERGHVQEFLTDRVLFRMRRYMPWLSGMTATSLTQTTSPSTITVNAPYAKRLYEGFSEAGNPLTYTTITNPYAGPRWDETLVSREGAAIAQEVQQFAEGRL